MPRHNLQSRHCHQHRRSFLDRFLLLSVAALLFLTHQARAGQGTELILTDGTRTTASLIELNYNAQSTAWRFAAPAGEILESNDTNQLVRWGNPAKAQRAATLILRDGSTLITDRTWSASGYARIDQESVGLNRRDGWATARRSEAQWLLLEAATEGVSQEKLLRSAAEDPSGNDVVWLVSGDQIEGQILSLKNNVTSILLGKDASPTEIPVSRVRAIRFASRQKARQQKPVCWVGMEDGSLLVAQSAQVSGQHATVMTLAGLSLEVEASSIVFLQPVVPHPEASSGQEISKNPTALRRVVKYLSSREADDYRSTPYFDLAWPYARDASLDGSPLQAGGRLYAKGLAMHSASRLVYQLENNPSLRFQAEIAIADSDLSVGSVIFRVYALRNGRVEPLYESPIVREGDSPLPIDMDLSDASALVLVVDYADNGDTGDQALWLDARLVNGG